MDLAQEAGHVGFFHHAFGPDHLTWTPGQCKLFGVDAGAAPASLAAWFELMDPRDREGAQREFWTACALRRDKATIEYGIDHPQRGRRWLSSRMLLQYDSDGHAAQLIGITVDMTDQRETERERAELVERTLAARQQAEAANRAKDEFLTMLSHELRNPLGAISAAVDVLEVSPPGSDSATEARAIVGRQTRNLAHMMEDLLDVGRTIAGKVQLSRRAVNLAGVAERVVRTLTLTGQASRHVIALDVQDAWFEGDSVRMEQVLTNLLANAIKYTPEGSPIRVHVIHEGDHAVAEVEDAGTIAPALLPHIFDLFVQGEQPLDRRSGGLGIGLTLVRRLVELHGGTVTATSSQHGSRFTVRLPAAAAPAQLQTGSQVPVRARHVLVIEDNADVLAALRAKLELDGHEVNTAADGIDGLRRLLQVRPEVSIVDIGLPGLTGYEVARHARAAGYSGRMVALSGYGRAQDLDMARTAGFDAYLVKPVNRQQLRESLHEQ